MARPPTPKRSQAVEQAREIPWKPLAVVAVVAAVIVAIVIFDPQPPGEAYPSLGNLHIATLEQPHTPYNSSPPSSGPHLGVLADWGVHEDPVPEELFIHNLEDGGVVFTYDCPDGCDDLVTGLSDIVDGGSRRLLTAYSGIENDGQSFRGAAAAWTKVYYFDELTEEVKADLQSFADLYEGVDHHVTSN